MLWFEKLQKCAFNDNFIYFIFNFNISQKFLQHLFCRVKLRWYREKFEFEKKLLEHLKLRLLKNFPRAPRIQICGFKFSMKSSARAISLSPRNWSYVNNVYACILAVFSNFPTKFSGSVEPSSAYYLPYLLRGFCTFSSNCFATSLFCQENGLKLERFGLYLSRLCEISF